MQNRFVGLPKTAAGKTIKTYLFKANRSTKVREVLWGDFLKVTGESADGWLEIEWAAGRDSVEKSFIPKAHTSETRPLEIIFLDVGQGDGAVLIAPEADQSERVVVLDAGISSNMHAFLDKRFRYLGEPMKLHAAIMTHPDKDHYFGFDTIFAASQKFGFDVVYHNGLAERPVSGQFEKLGGVTTDAATGKKYVADLAETRADIEALFGPGVDLGDFDFPRVMRSALENPNIADIRMLSTAHGVEADDRVWMPGFEPSGQRPYAVEILGPVVEPDAGGAPRLRKLGSYGETKNGHSVLLRLHYGKFKVLFGGDLNDKAEKFLLAHYAGLSRFPRAGTAAHDAMVETTANWFRAEVMKTCHHGSEKVTDAFLDTVLPAAFVISSGDEEGHVHPRPDLLGRLGKRGRGDTPVILSTELQRSTREMEDAKAVESLIRRVLDLSDSTSDKAREKIIDDIWTLGRSNVTVYGAIYLKTDGERLLTAFRIETGSETKKWFTFEYEYVDGELRLVA
ncbi:MAG: hypothetical protein KKB66_08170 [Alphaproteobacteria bacterium]|nr:hypothetical protein [Alphaproteobacteria bacterium]MBU0802555.1 hypothetical protein [Alphaproteobacteria bacterium]MBU0871352.1 hypothetical protein [Alphaproteobacteria bacterium]MBU1400019.1 hypothetical protein [Alphaproteobacteria bacterium]MBU1591139.1 hypothetical protein [Alphaproteobacteria bacterium]